MGNIYLTNTINTINFSRLINHYETLGMVFIECMSGHPIIRKESSIKQYNSIIKHFGVQIADQKSLNQKMKKTYNNVISIKYIHANKFPNVGAALKKYYPQWPNDLIKIVSNCLQFKPSKRKTTKLLLNEEFFINRNFSTCTNQ